MSDISTHSILAENIAAKWHQHAQANDHRSQGMKLPETKTKTETSRPKTSQSIKVHSERKKECEKVSSSKTSKECYRLGYGGGGRYGRGRGWDGCVGGRYGSGGRRGSSDGGGGWGDDGRRGGGYGGGRGGGGSGRGGGGRGGGSGCRRASGGGGGGGFRKSKSANIGNLLIIEN